jgi:excisionase family DNA binding protein
MSEELVGESIRALATVTLDAGALEGLGPRMIDRLADLVAERLVERRATGEQPLLRTADAARAAGVHPDTVRRAIRSGALRVAGYVGNRPRLRRRDVEEWIAGGRAAPGVVTVSSWVTPAAKPSAGPNGHRRVLRDALRVAEQRGPTS